ncbi:MAG: hypothetical protein LUG13_10010 [Oscillospiraceae bacterium]|nr:hypothetical protein [Oscillospiraceae bacterium]
MPNAFCEMGVESMSNAPYLLTGARSGYRMGDGKLIDTCSTMVLSAP